MTPQAAKEEGVSEIYELLRLAAARRQPVSAIYDGQSRLLCPHVGGRKSGRHHVFLYQFGGSSNSGPSALSKNRPFPLTKSDPHEEHDLPMAKKNGKRYHPRRRRAVCFSLIRAAGA